MSKRILIVEDTVSEALFLKQELEKAQYEVTYVQEAAKALKMLEIEKHDLIILDVLLPGMDGFELCRIIRQNELFVNIPIIFYSKVPDIDACIDEKLIALELGAADFLSKTSDIRELIIRVKNLIKTKSNIESLLEVSFFDSLTKIYNKKYFLKRLNEECARSQRYGHIFSCAILNIDNLKLINDELGSNIGNIALQKVAMLLKRYIRTAGEAYRYENSLFALLLPEKTQETAYTAVEFIRKSIVASDEIKKESIKDLTLSCGISSFSDRNTDPNIILEQAMTALEAAKENGKNQTKLFAELN